MSGLTAGNANELILQGMWKQMKAPIMFPVSTHRAPSLLPVMLPLSSHHLGLPTASDLPPPARGGDQPSSPVQFPAFPGCFAHSMTPMPLLPCLLSPSPYSPLISFPLELPAAPRAVCFREPTSISHPFFAVPAIISQLGHTQGQGKNTTWMLCL